jgi:hypothetical protein
MTTILFSTIRRLAAPALMAAAILFPQSPAEAGCSSEGSHLIKTLSGSWRGRGSVTPIGASRREQISCRIRYSSRSSDQLQQHLKCAGADYKIEATSNVSCDGKTVSGSWLEQIAHNTGGVSGSIGNNFLNLEVDGPNFKGRFAVNFSSSGKHTVTITQFDPAKGRHVRVARITLVR